MYAQVRSVRYRVSYLYGRAKIPRDLATSRGQFARKFTRPRCAAPSDVRESYSHVPSMVDLQMLIIVTNLSFTFQRMSTE